MSDNNPNYDFYDEEHLKGIRFNYNTFPVTRQEEGQCVVPIGAIFSPLGSSPTDTNVTDGVIISHATKCLRCDGFFNKYCKIDLAANVWNCCFCGSRNPGIVNGNDGGDNCEFAIPLEYSSRKISIGNGGAYLYVVDLNTEETDLEALKESLVESIYSLPMGSHVCLITYDENVYIHEQSVALGIRKKLTLRGDKIYPDLQELLDIKNVSPQLNLSRYFHSLFDEYQKSKFISEIQSIKTTPNNANERPKRAHGTVLLTSIQLSRSLKQFHVHILNFISGPGTVGPGKITSTSKIENIRSFSDITKNRAKYFQESSLFYNKLLDEKDQNISINFFIASYDQVGVYEMKELSKKTGGVVILNDSFSMNLFRMNFRKMFQATKEGSHLIDFNSNCELKVVTSKGLLVAGFVGDGVVSKSDASDKGVSDVEIGDGFGRVLKTAYITSRTHFNIFFKVNTVGYANEKQALPCRFYIQFQTKFFNSDGSEMLRVITVERTSTNEPGHKIEDDFDQEACIVLITKHLIHQLLRQKIQFKQTQDILKDYLLKFMKNFGIYIKNEPASFKPFSNFQQLPNFFYNLIHKSLILSNFNNTPDEFTYLTSNFFRINTNDSLLTIQPILLAYSLDTAEPTPIPLDLAYFKHDEIILMDSFTHVLIHFGTTIAQWRDSDLDPEEYSNVHELIEEPKLEAMEILRERFPLSRYIVTDDGASQDRFLKSKLNSGLGRFSDDVDLKAFYQDLVQKVCL